MGDARTTHWMKRCLFVTVTLGLVASPITVTWAQTAPPTRGGIAVSGHLDVQAIGWNAAVENNNFELGQLAVDLKSELNRRTTAAMQLAYGYDDQIAIDEAYIDWNLYRWDGRPRTDPVGVLQTGVKVGQFDVPFGIEWRDYSSIDRRTVSLPLIVTTTHRGWNDLGVLYYGETQWANWAVFAVNGFGVSPTLRLPDRPSPVHLTAGGVDAADVASSDLVPTEAYGARAGIIMNEHFEFGTSFAAGYTDDNRQDERLFGFDLTANFAALQLKGEFINHQRERTWAKESIYGYYLEGSYSSGRWFGVLRQDAVNPDGGIVYPLDVTSNTTVFSASLGGGYRVADKAQLRLEYQLAEGARNDVVFLQTVVAF
jgi:hypothetical protein